MEIRRVNRVKIGNSFFKGVEWVKDILREGIV